MRVIEIGGSPAKMLLLLLGCAVMIAVSVVLAMKPLPDERFADVGQVVGYIGALVFGVFMAVGLWRFATTSGPVVTIGPEGFRDTRVAAEFIPWKAVQKISTWEYSGQKAMVLAVDPAVEQQLTLTRIARWSRAPNRKLGVDGLAITAAGLKTDYDTLLSTTLSYARTGGAQNV